MLGALPRTVAAKFMDAVVINLQSEDKRTSRDLLHTTESYKQYTCSLLMYQPHDTYRHQGSEKRGFLQKPNPLFFGVFIRFWALLDFLFEQAVGKLVGSHRSSAMLLFRFANTLDYLKIHKFINYWALKAASIKKSFISKKETVDLYRMSGHYY